MTYKKQNPLISIIIPTKDKVGLLRECISSIENKSQYKNYEIIVVDNNSKKVESKSYLSNLKHKVISFNEPWNYARINNFAVKEAGGEYVIFLNNDTEVISSDWIERMLEYSERPEVGAVGVKLLYPDNTVQHAGVLIGVGGIASHAFEGLPPDEPGYQGLLQCTRHCSAVTGACIMVRKTVFQEVGGFDEHLANGFEDVDFCLRLRKKRYSIIYTPHAELYHHTTSTRSYTMPVEEMKYFVERWRDLILEGDPYYDPSLSRVKQYSPKIKEERFMLTDVGLFEESQLGTLAALKRYVKIANMIAKRHGVRRLTLEFLRYLTIKVQRK